MKALKILVLLNTIMAFNPINAYSFTGELTLKTYSGSINNKYNITMVLYTYTLGTYNRLMGYYYYNSNKLPIFIDGLKEADKYTITEFLENGTANAIFEGAETGDKISGTWKMGTKEFVFQLATAEGAGLSIHSTPNTFPAGVYHLKWARTEGSISVNQPGFSFDLVSLPDAHIGNLEAQWQVHPLGLAYYFVSEDPKNMDLNCLFFFLTFNNKLYVFQVGKPEYFDFGSGVSAQGVYHLMK